MSIPSERCIIKVAHIIVVTVLFTYLFITFSFICFFLEPSRDNLNIVKHKVATLSGTKGDIWKTKPMTRNQQ
jgi:lipopolysaccharide/colanic/teichoic acid biosynthesis glycosyltransferase